jgi:hypothetical protein
LVEVRPDVYLFLSGVAPVRTATVHRIRSATVHRIRSANPVAPLTDRYHPIRFFSDSSIPESAASAPLSRVSTRTDLIPDVG